MVGRTSSGTRITVWESMLEWIEIVVYFPEVKAAG